MYDFCGDAGYHHRSQDKHKQIPIKRGPKLGLGSSGLTYSLDTLLGTFRTYLAIGKLYSFGLWAKFK